MGEIADMMLGGEMCPCGEYLGGGDGIGFPQYCCKQCERDFGGAAVQTAGALRIHPCPKCGRCLKSPEGVKQHLEAKHGGTA